MTMQTRYGWVTALAIVFGCFVAVTSGAEEQGASAGKDVFAKRCTGCHSLDSSKEGPRLRGVVGRKAGSVAEFVYSDALRNSGIVWSESLLERWLEDPEVLVKQNDMEFHVPRAQERAALVAYLKTPGN